MTRPAYKPTGQMVKRPRYPESVPFLTRADICKGGLFDTKSNTCCLEGWVQVIEELLFLEARVRQTRSERRYIANVMRHSILKACKELGLVDGYLDADFAESHLPDYNDHRKNSHAKLAEAFNLGMRKLGYVHLSKRTETISVSTLLR